MGYCLICHKALDLQYEGEYHYACAKRLFGTDTAPVLDISLDDIETAAAASVSESVTVPGVQPKLSLHLDSGGDTNRLTIVGLWGGFVLKPPFGEFPGLPENEDAVMRLADSAGIETVPHGLIRFKTGELGYITRRIDRNAEGKIHMEDFCQLTEHLTQEKYNGSLEAASKVISRYATNPGFDLIRLFSIAVFSFLVGNGDMHLKNYSLVRMNDGTVSLSPAYDLVSTVLAMPSDKEETALTINGKKHQLKYTDFLALAAAMKIPAKVAEREIGRFSAWEKTAADALMHSFLNDDGANRLKSLIHERALRLRI